MSEYWYRRIAVESITKTTYLNYCLYPVFSRQFYSLYVWLWSCNIGYASFRLEPEIPSNISVTNITTSSMQIDWSTNGTNVINLTTVSYTCGNNQQMQNVTANWIVLSNLTAACNISFCITILSYDKRASVCSWAVTSKAFCDFSLVKQIIIA